MHRVRIRASIWIYELCSWVGDAPEQGERVVLGSVDDARALVRGLLFEAPHERARVRALVDELDRPAHFGGLAHGDEPWLERVGWLLVRGQLRLYRYAELMSSEPRPERFVQDHDYVPPVNEIAEHEGWMFWDELGTAPALDLDAEHVPPPPLQLEDEVRPHEGLVLDGEEVLAEGLSLDAEHERAGVLALEAEHEPYRPEPRDPTA